MVAVDDAVPEPRKGWREQALCAQRMAPPKQRAQPAKKAEALEPQAVAVDVCPQATTAGCTRHGVWKAWRRWCSLRCRSPPYKERASPVVPSRTLQR